MGWGKKIRKAVKHVTKPVRKAVKQVTKPVEKVVKHAVGAVVPAPKMPKQAPAQVVEQAAPPAAQLVDVPDKKDVDTDDEAQTESGRRKAARSGKKALSVTRSSGGGINI